jgi:hypothetical protein
MNESLHLLDLNIENDKHVDLVLPFFKKINPEVLVIQELFEDFVEPFSQQLKMECVFTPLCLKNRKIDNQNKSIRWGQAIFTNQKIIQSKSIFYVGSENNIKLFDIDNQRETRFKALTVVNIKKASSVFTVGTSHFTAATSKLTTDEQREDFIKLKTVLASFPDIILTGDFNTPRGGEIYSQLSRMYKDNFPPEYTTSIDKNFHRDGDIQCVVDGLFTTPQYSVSQIKIHDGVSDHFAIEAAISRK